MTLSRHKQATTAGGRMTALALSALAIPRQGGRELKPWIKVLKVPARGR